MEKTNNIIAYFEHYLDSNNLRNTEIENYIVRYLLIFCCAEFSEIIREIIFSRVRSINDPLIINYVEKSIDLGFKNPTMENIYKVLGQFDRDLKRIFKQNVDTQIINSWETLINNRNEVAHKTQCTISITITELKTYLSNISSIYDQIEAILR